MKMILLGTGTSHGIPVISCDCAVCHSKDRKDKRTRTSAYVVNKNHDKSESHILIDVSPEFRLQAIKHKINSVDAVLLTHSHADHLHGLDDLRIFSHTMSSSHLLNPDKGKETEGKGLSIYSNRKTLEDVKNRFSYVFKETQLGGGKPKLCLEHKSNIEKNKDAFGDLKVIPVSMMHGEITTTGWIFSVSGKKDGMIHSIVYLTDCNYISEKNINKIIQKGGKIDHLVIDGLKIEKHSTHYSFMEAMEIANRIGAKHTWITHICHYSLHIEIQQYINEHLEKFPLLEESVRNGGSVAPAYDGLILRTEN